MEHQRRWQGWVLVGPALLVTLALFAAPMVMVVLTSLYRRSGGLTDRTLSFDNYIRLATDSTIHQALWNSIEVVALTVIFSTLIAYPFAYIVAYKVPQKWQALVLLLTVVPFWTSYVVRSYSWLLVLAKNGVINQTLVSWGIIAEPFTMANTRFATVLAFVHFFVMVSTLTIYASLRQIPRNLGLAARDLGASPLSVFLRITLPLSIPGVVVGAFLTFVLAIGDYITPQIVGGGNELVLPQLLMLQVSRMGDFPLAAAMALVLLIIVAAVYAVSAKNLTLERKR